MRKLLSRRLFTKVAAPPIAPESTSDSVHTANVEEEYPMWVLPIKDAMTLTHL